MQPSQAFPCRPAILRLAIVRIGAESATTATFRRWHPKDEIIMVSAFRLVTLVLLGSVSIDSVYSQWNTGSQRRKRRHRLHSNHHDPWVWSPPDLQELNEMATDTILDQLLDEILLDTNTHTGTSTNTLIHPYHPSRTWLWRQWKTTMFYSTIGT